MTVVPIARCPEHGLHGQRDECFVCDGPVEQVPMVAVEDMTPTYVVRAKPEGDSIEDTWFTSDNFGGDPELSRIEAHQYAAQTGRRLEVRWTTPWQDEPIDRSVS